MEEREGSMQAEKHVIMNNHNLCSSCAISLSEVVCAGIRV